MKVSATIHDKDLIQLTNSLKEISRNWTKVSSTLIQLTNSLKDISINWTKVSPTIHDKDLIQLTNSLKDISRTFNRYVFIHGAIVDLTFHLKYINVNRLLKVDPCFLNLKNSSCFCYYCHYWNFWVIMTELMTWF